MDEKLTAEQIAERYPSLTLEQVYATILYYLHNKEALDSYLETYLAESQRRQQEQERNPLPALQRLRELRARRDAFPPEERADAWKRLIAEEHARSRSQKQPA